MIRWIGVGITSIASLLASHAVHAKPVEMSKSSKKSAPGETRSADDMTGVPGIDETLRTAENPPHKYPWKTEIVTTTFWVGEKPTANNPVPNHKSCWDPRWAENYGGTDTPNRAERNSAYTPADFVPRQNPFYVALPYNDMTSKGHKPEAAAVIPWFKEAAGDGTSSVCKGRWIAIRHGNRVCYAQWEDAGPFRTDHWQYVFGSERPKPNLNQGAGLDVSPAVRDYLGMDDTDITDWKFVDFEEVPMGPWGRLGDNNTFVINRRAANKVAELAALKTKAALPSVIE